MSRILCTGATGLVGTNLVKKLREDGHDVYQMSRSLNLDLQDVERTNKFFELVKPEVVYHLAANGAEARGQVVPRDMTQRNVGIFVNALTAAINVGVKKFIYTSSISVYGDADAPYSEDTVCKPKDVYGANKLACEHILKIMAKVYGFDYTIFRPHNIYGIGQKMDDPYRNVVALFMRRLMEGQSYKLYGDGSAKRAFSYVDDVVNVLASALDNPEYSGITMNVGSENPVTIKELSDTLQRITGITVPIEYVPSRPQEIDNFLASHTIQESITNYVDTPLEEGLRKTWEWLQTQKLPPLITQENEINV